MLVTQILRLSLKRTTDSSKSVLSEQNIDLHITEFCTMSVMQFYLFKAKTKPDWSNVIT